MVLAEVAPKLQGSAVSMVRIGMAYARTIAEAATTQEGTADLDWADPTIHLGHRVRVGGSCYC